MHFECAQNAGNGFSELGRFVGGMEGIGSRGEGSGSGSRA